MRTTKPESEFVKTQNDAICVRKSPHNENEFAVGHVDGTLAVCLKFLLCRFIFYGLLLLLCVCVCVCVCVCKHRKNTNIKQKNQ